MVWLNQLFSPTPEATGKHTELPQWHETTTTAAAADTAAHNCLRDARTPERHQRLITSPTGETTTVGASRGV